MGNWKAVPRKRRKHPAIDVASLIFSYAMRRKDYKRAAAITLWCTLEVVGAEGIMQALEDANSAIRRRKYRKEL